MSGLVSDPKAGWVIVKWPDGSNCLACCATDSSGHNFIYLLSISLASCGVLRTADSSRAAKLFICWVLPFLPVGLCVPLTALCATNSARVAILSFEYFLTSCGALCVSVSDHNSICYFPFFLWGFVCLWQLCVPLTALELQFYLLSISLLSVGLCVSLSLTTILSVISLSSCGALCASDSFVCH